MNGNASIIGTQDDDGAAEVVVVDAQVVEEDECDDSTDTDTDNDGGNNEELGGDAAGTKMQIPPSTNSRKSHSMRIKLPLFKKRSASSIDNSALSRDSATSMHDSLPVNRKKGMSKISSLLGGDGEISRNGQRKLGSFSENANICLVGAAVDEVKSKNSSVVGHISHAVDSSSISEKTSKLNSCQSFPSYLSTFLNSNHFYTKNISECLSQIQPVRIPDIVASPGLMLPPAPLNTPTVVFRNVMKKALASRSRSASGLPNAVEPFHKGSSIQRCVDDMFDSLVVNMAKEVDVSNVLSAVHIDDALISENLRRKTIKRKELDFFGSNQDAETSKVHVCDKASINCKNVPLVSAVFDSINVALKKQKLQHETDENNCNEPQKLKTYALSFIDMVPTSLTSKYPFEYIQKHRTFLEIVEMRELAILDAQSAQDCFNSKMDSYEDSLCKWNDKMIVRSPSDTSFPIPDKSCLHPLQTHPIPLIPSPPSPIRFKETDTTQKSFLKHLDFDQFQAPCRYHNLMSNRMIDQHFVGPCAPGIVALTTGSNSANTLNLSPIAGRATSLKAESQSRSKPGFTSEEKSLSLRTKSSKKKSKNAIKSQELRAIFESNSEYVATMRDSLIRAAISCFTNGNGDGRTPWIGTSLICVFVLMLCLCSRALTVF